MTVYDPSTGYRDERVENLGNSFQNLLDSLGDGRPGEGVVAGLFCGLGSIDADLASLKAATAFAEWLVAMDDPEDVLGREERRTVTLTKIIDRARAALEQP